MVKLMKIDNTYADGKKSVVIYADTKAEIGEDWEITGFDVNQISAGSVAFTKSFDVGVFDSDGAINWL